MAVSSTFVATDGDGYERVMGRWSRRLAPLFIEFAGISEGARVLDVGCGTGSLTFALAGNPAIASVRGLDFSPVYVEHAARRNTDSRVEFQEGDACALPFETGYFDHALSMLVLQFIPQADIAVEEMRRVTRPGGTVAAATWDTRGGLIVYRLLFDTAAAIDPQANQRRARVCTRPLTRPGELARAWHKAGLADVVEGMLTIRMDFASFADFWGPYEGKDGPVADYLGTLDAPAKARLRGLVELAYLDGDPDGPRSYAATAWAVKGKVPG
jgi:SAM-dependent methyltransferase